MPRCAFLSIATPEGWFIDDDLVHPHLQKLGWEVQTIPWQADTDWNQFDLVVVRSPWDYQAHLEAFISVLEKIEASRARLLNPLSLMRWNMHKDYLFELEQKGVQLVPTLRIAQLTEREIWQAFDYFNTEQLIVKPLIGANADDTFRLHVQKPETWKSALQVFSTKEGMIQPFMNSILEEGEFSLIYVDGRYSHSLLKTVGKGDFRVQEEHGGGVIPIPDPENSLLQTAEKALAVLPITPFYARVDLVRTGSDQFSLMELELIEPCLYFRFDLLAAEKFAATLHRYFLNESS